MDHGEALVTHAVERYLLGELAPAEAEDFERHFFTCAECAAAVDEGQRLMSEVRKAREQLDETQE